MIENISRCQLRIVLHAIFRACTGGDNGRLALTQDVATPPRASSGR